MTIHFPFDNSYARLPDRLFARLAPTPVRAAKLLAFNDALAGELGLDAAALRGADGLDVLAGRRLPDGADPIATAYAGHQFGNFVPQLGDGRAILLGEVIGRDGGRRDLQLKGAGPTPFSRMGDGRAAIGPVLREYLVSEAMAALGIPTTRALAAVATGEVVIRDGLLPGAVLTRVASSHIRVGTFQFFAARGDVEALRSLADHVIARHYPELAGDEHPARALLDALVARQAALVARWLNVGFVHGVMNTDNTSVAGETIDYGPCAFLDAYDPAACFSSIDAQGRYAFANQPRIAHWNLTRFAEALLPLLADDADAAIAEATAVLERFGPRFEAAYHDGLRRKLGLADAREDDAPLAGELLKIMAENRADFTRTFRLLGEAAADPSANEPLRELFIDPTSFDRWAARWRARLADDPRDASARRAAMHAVNPAYIPRNHHVEAALAAAAADDLGPFEALLAAVSRPFDERADLARFAVTPEPAARDYRTFCGT